MKNMNTEKKITKKEQKAMESRNKREFIQKVFMLTLEAVGEATTGNGSKLKIQITEQYQNRYVKLQMYGKSMNIQIFRDGNVVLELKEALHGDFSQTMFSFDLDDSAQKEFFERYTRELQCVINEYLDRGPLDFHSYMDYVWDVGDYWQAYLELHGDYHNDEEPEPDEESDVNG